jgi:predicted ribosomally synthesized peptide with nif11-like leader
MSTQAVQAFTAKLQQDEAFRNQVQAVMTAAQQRNSAELLKVAAGAGFQFTEAELAATLQGQLKQRYAAGELRDEDLLQVSGGTLYTVTTLSGAGILALTFVEGCF